MTLCFQRGLPALHQPCDITAIQVQRDHLRVRKRKKAENAGNSSERLAQQIACQCLIWKHFFQAIPVMWFSVSYTTYFGLACSSPHKQHQNTWVFMHFVTLFCTAIWNTAIIYLFKCAAARGCYMTLVSHLLENCPNHWKLVKSHLIWMNEHGPADRSRSLCR